MWSSINRLRACCAVRPQSWRSIWKSAFWWGTVGAISIAAMPLGASQPGSIAAMTSRCAKRPTSGPIRSAVRWKSFCGCVVEKLQDTARNPLAGPAVAIWVVCARHRFVSCAIVQQPLAFFHDLAPVRSHQPCGSGCDSFGAFRLAAQHQNRLAEGRRFFLHPAGIGQHEPGAQQQVDEGRILERLDEPHPGLACKVPAHRIPHLRVRMDRVYDLYILANGKVGKRGADLVEAR